MKKPVVDYRKFRFSKLRDPEYRHMLLLLGWVGYFLLYVLTENLIPPERCHPIHCALDDLTLEEFRSFDSHFDQDIYDAISMKNCVERRNTAGAAGRVAC